MIKNFEEYTCKLNDFELSLVNGFCLGLISKKGKQNAITNRQIIDSYNKQGIKLSSARVRKIINHIRINGLVSRVCATSDGYYIAANDEEFNEYLQSLHERINAQIIVYKSLRNQ